MNKIYFVAVLVLFSLNVQAKSMRVKAAERAENARLALVEMFNAPDRPIGVFNQARCIVVVPNVIKGAFFVGGRYGRGLASCREGSGWSTPSFVGLGGPSFGLQFGGNGTDLILFFMRNNARDRVCHGNVTFGPNATIAVGPLGRDGQLATDYTFRAEILSYARARGLFAGISLEGDGLGPDEKMNAAFYGREPTPCQTLSQSGLGTPPALQGFVAELNRIR